MRWLGVFIPPVQLRDDSLETRIINTCIAAITYNKLRRIMCDAHISATFQFCSTMTPSTSFVHDVSVDGRFTLKPLFGLRRECEFCNHLICECHVLYLPGNDKFVYLSQKYMEIKAISSSIG